MSPEYLDTEQEALQWKTSHAHAQFSPSVHEVFSALVKAQAQMGAAHKGAENPFFRSHYADLSEVLRVCKDAMNDNGLAILQPISTGKKGVTVTTLLIHTSGEWISSSVDFPVGKLDSQEYGKAVSYGRRYSLMSFLSIPTEDDDGETARKQHPRSQKPSPPVQKPAPPAADPQATNPVEAPKTQTMVLEPSPVQEASWTNEGDIDFRDFAVNEDRIAEVMSVEEKTSRDGTKTWWVIEFASKDRGKDRGFTAKIWDPASMYKLPDYINLVGQPVWYRISEKEYRGAMQYTLHYIGLVDPES